MCGIAGVVGRPTAGDPSAAVAAMNRAQAHRGPDDQGLWKSEPGADGGPVVLGHRRLSIIDLSPDGHQPMIDPASGCALVFNCRRSPGSA